MNMKLTRSLLAALGAPLLLPLATLAPRRAAAAADGVGTSSYHGRYVVSDTADGATPAGVPAEEADARDLPSAAAPPPQPDAPPPPALASAASTSSKLANLRERTGPAVALLAAVGLLLKYAGSPGFVGLVLAMQAAMYRETTSVVGGVSGEEGGEVGPVWSSVVEEWWWFATAVMLTSGRCVSKRQMK